MLQPGQVASQQASLSVAVVFQPNTLVLPVGTQAEIVLFMKGWGSEPQEIFYSYLSRQRKTHSIPTWVGKLCFQNAQICGISDFIRLGSAPGDGMDFKVII